MMQTGRKNNRFLLVMFRCGIKNKYINMSIDCCYLSKNDCYKDEDFHCERLYLINTYIRSENNKIAFTDIKNQYIEENT